MLSFICHYDGQFLFQIQLDDAETNAIKWGRKMVAKLEGRCRELEAELDAEQRRVGDAHKNLRKAERGIKEYTFRSEEDRKNAERMRDLVDKLQMQIKTYKKQIEEAEEIAALNLSKFRWVKQNKHLLVVGGILIRSNI